MYCRKGFPKAKAMISSTVWRHFLLYDVRCTMDGGHERSQAKRRKRNARSAIWYSTVCTIVHTVLETKRWKGNKIMSSKECAHVVK